MFFCFISGMCFETSDESSPRVGDGPECCASPLRPPRSSQAAPPPQQVAPHQSSGRPHQESGPVPCQPCPSEGTRCPAQNCSSPHQSPPRHPEGKHLDPPTKILPFCTLIYYMIIARANLRKLNLFNELVVTTPTSLLTVIIESVFIIFLW